MFKDAAGRTQPSGSYRLLLLRLLASGALLFSSTATAGHSRAAADQWIGTWAAAGSTTGPFDTSAVAPNDQTLRQIVRISQGGEQLRVRLSNIKGTAPLTIGAATVALRGQGARVTSGSLRPLTFGGKVFITIPAGARVLSDPVALPTSDLAELAVSLYLPDGAAAPTSPVTTHVRALQTAYLLSGDQTNISDPLIESTLTSWYYLTGVEVTSRKPMAVLAILGDSIANGDGSTPDTNQRWPDLLAQRVLQAGSAGKRRSRFRRAPKRIGVLNLGISGNQITRTVIGDNAQARFDRDILTQTGVTHVIIMAGINDLGLPGLLNQAGTPTPQVSVETVISGYRQLIARARARGLVVIGGTLTPSGGFGLPDYFLPATDAKRQIINDWIRNSGAFDAVIDFDAVLRDPANPAQIRADLTADGLHPNDAGYRAMAEAVPLKLLRLRGRSRTR